MRVKCIRNDLDAISGERVRRRLARSIHLDGPDSTLTVGSDYLVQAIERKDGGLWLYLHTVDVVGYPHPYPAEMFEVMDSRVSENWCVRTEDGPDGRTWKRIAFSEWAEDDAFYERLVDDDENALGVYQRNMVRP
jgi:hypothetical protein